MTRTGGWCRWGVSLVLLAYGTGIEAGDWPQFRGPQGAAVSEETGLPVRWSATENIRWKAELPGRGLSCPVIVGPRVYVTACSGYQQTRLHVLCFEAQTGRKLWERQLWTTGSTMCHPTTCMAAPTPAADADGVCALFATADLAAYDSEGNLLWYRSLSRDYPGITNNVGMAASPVLLGELLFLPLENAGHSFAAALDRRTGATLWKVDRHRDINWITPLVVRQQGRDAVLFQTGKEITAYEPRTGRRLWSYEASLSTVSSPVLGEGRILVPGGEFLALRADTDSAEPEILWKSSRIKTSFPSPVFHRGRLYTLNQAGILQCHDAAEGQLLWQVRLRGPFWATPVIAGQKLYALNEEGTTFVVDLAATSDEARLVAQNRLEDKFLATPAIAHRCLFLRSDKYLYCIGEKDK
jgi:outer membrane protein assembly factor BamB